MFELTFVAFYRTVVHKAIFSAMKRFGRLLSQMDFKNLSFQIPPLRYCKKVTIPISIMPWENTNVSTSVDVAEWPWSSREKVDTDGIKT